MGETNDVLPIDFVVLSRGILRNCELGGMEGWV